ncbi:MAG: mandelate racemase/muconate lactonizing enzyme family protein, partial [Pseudomonadota bacterium]
MKIKSIQAVLLGHRKTDPPMQRSYALVRVETEAGLIGYGEASSNYGHSYPTVIKTIIDDIIAPNLVGHDALDIRGRADQMHVLLDGYLGWDGVSSQVIGGVEVALWDILGKELNQPIFKLLGASARPMALYGTGTTMFEATPEWYAKYFDDSLARGIKAVKVRLGTERPHSVERVAGVREYVGKDVRIMVDAYWGFSPDEALILTKELEPYDVYFFEEPSPQYQLEGFKRLCAGSPIRIAVGERVYTPSHFNLIAQMGAAHVFEPDACLSGGISACMEIAAIARAHDIKVVPHTGSPTAVG